MASGSEANGAGQAGRGVVKSPQDFGAGLFLIAFAAFAYWAGWSLPTGTLSSVGSGMLPTVMAVMLAAFGALLIVDSLIETGPMLERWALRGPFFVLGAILLFAWTIRPLGLVIAGPLVVVVSSLADKDTRILEVMVFGIIMTAACIGLFHYVLGLPMPILPTSAPYPFNLLF